MSVETPDEPDLSDLEDQPFNGWLLTVEVCVLTPEGEVASGGDLCLYVECEFDHNPTYEEIGTCALDETQPWIASFLYGGRFQERFGNNPSITLGNIIWQRL